MTHPTTTGAIVVGIDGSPRSDLALAWAAEQAGLEQLPLVLLHALPTQPAGPTPYVHHELLDQLRANAEVLLTNADRRARADHHVSDVHPALENTDPRTALLHASARASILVVGDRGLGPVRQLLLGSVSHAMIQHAESPVVVVRPGHQESRHRGILVAVAGDGHDDAVLDFAFRVAHTRELPVTLVHCIWDAIGVAEGVREVPAGEPGYEDERAILEETARRPSILHPDVPVSLMLSRGFTEVQLIAASQQAELLVIGHRRKHFLRELFYGSIAPRVVEHAHCPVAVVPLGQEQGESDQEA